MLAGEVMGEFLPENLIMHRTMFWVMKPPWLPGMRRATPSNLDGSHGLCRFHEEFKISGKREVDKSPTAMLTSRCSHIERDAATFLVSVLTSRQEL